MFEGTYEFIDASEYHLVNKSFIIFDVLFLFLITIDVFIVGKPVPHQLCSYTIFSDEKREGQFMSPTYPGVYTKNLKCQYQFIGKKGQRVQIEFLDFDLFSGGSQLV